MRSLVDAVGGIGGFVRNMPTRTRWYAFALLCLAALFYAIVVHPAHARLLEADREYAALRRQMGLQSDLLPLYTRLKASTDAGALAGLPRTTGATFPKSEVQKMESKLSAIARENRVQLVSAASQPVLKSGVANRMRVDAVVKGGFADFREFLLGMAALQGFDGISHLEMTRESGREVLTARMWIVVE